MYLILPNFWFNWRTELNARLAVTTRNQQPRGHAMDLWHESEIEQLIEALLCDFSVEWIVETLQRSEDDIRMQIARLGYVQGSTETLH